MNKKQETELEIIEKLVGKNKADLITAFGIIKKTEKYDDYDIYFFSRSGNWTFSQLHGTVKIINLEKKFTTLSMEKHYFKLLLEELKLRKYKAGIKSEDGSSKFIKGRIDLFIKLYVENNKPMIRIRAEWN